MRYEITHTRTGQSDHWTVTGSGVTLCGRTADPLGEGYGPCETCDRIMRARVTVADVAPGWFTGVWRVWSAYGHRFMSTGNYEDEVGNIARESCITCGAEYPLVPDPADPGRGEYQGPDGGTPMACSGRTDLIHGTERYCDADNGRDCADMIDNGTCQ